MKRPLALVAISLLSLSCQHGPKRPDAAALVRAYEDWQKATATDRPAALRAFESATCKDPPTCADRDACVTYARTLTRAQELVQKARELGPEDAGGNGAATEAQLAIIVGGADDATKEATAKEPECRAAPDRLYALNR